MSERGMRGLGLGGDTGTALQELVRTREPARYRVLMLDDDFTPMDLVERILEKYFNMSPAEATRTMLEVHHSGVALCGVYLHEIAESKVSEATAYARAKNYPLQMTLERE